MGAGDWRVGKDGPRELDVSFNPVVDRAPLHCYVLFTPW